MGLLTFRTVREPIPVAQRSICYEGCRELIRTAILTPPSGAHSILSYYKNSSDIPRSLPDDKGLTYSPTEDHGGNRAGGLKDGGERGELRSTFQPCPEGLRDAGQVA